MNKSESGPQEDAYGLFDRLSKRLWRIADLEKKEEIGNTELAIDWTVAYPEGQEKLPEGISKERFREIESLARHPLPYLTRNRFLGMEYWEEQAARYFDSSERAMPIGDPRVESNENLRNELAHFLVRSLSSFWESISPEEAASLLDSMALITTTEKGRSYVSNGFMHEGVIHTGQHVSKGADKVTITHLFWKRLEIKDGQIDKGKYSGNEDAITISAVPEWMKNVPGSIKLKGSYSISISSLPSNFRYDWKNPPFALVVHKIDILSSPDPQLSKGRGKEGFQDENVFHYDGYAQKGDSGSMILDGWKPIWVLAFWNKQKSEYFNQNLSVFGIDIYQQEIAERSSMGWGFFLRGNMEMKACRNRELVWPSGNGLLGKAHLSYILTEENSCKDVIRESQIPASPTNGEVFHLAQAHAGISDSENDTRSTIRYQLAIQRELERIRPKYLIHEWDVGQFEKTIAEHGDRLRVLPDNHPEIEKLTYLFGGGFMYALHHPETILVQRENAELIRRLFELLHSRPKTEEEMARMKQEISLLKEEVENGREDQVVSAIAEIKSNDPKSSIAVVWGAGHDFSDNFKKGFPGWEVPWLTRIVWPGLLIDRLRLVPDPARIMETP